METFFLIVCLNIAPGAGAGCTVIQRYDFPPPAENRLVCEADANSMRKRRHAGEDGFFELKVITCGSDARQP